MEHSRAAKGAVHSEIVDALVRWMPHELAKEIVRRIVRGEIPRLAVNYDA
jgi:hypothetical protein